MTDRYPHGTIAWTELFASDAPRQRDFYAALLGWRFDDRLRASSGTSGKPVAAVRPRADGLRGWAPFIAVDDVGAVQRAVLEASGRVHGEGDFEDPSGGRFFAWAGAPFEGPHGLNAPGGLAWNEVWSSDTAATIAFYRRALGWNLKEQPGFGGAPYTMFAGRDRPGWTHAGIRSLDGPGPTRWMSYFEVEGCARTVEAARGLGAEITMPATHVPGVGWLATARDLEGSMFGLMQSGG